MPLSRSGAFFTVNRAGFAGGSNSGSGMSAIPVSVLRTGPTAESQPPSTKGEKRVTRSGRLSKNSFGRALPSYRGDRVVHPSERRRGSGGDALAKPPESEVDAIRELSVFWQKRLTAARISSADLVHRNGFGLALCWAMKLRISASSWATEVWTPRWIFFRVSSANQRST